MNLPGIRSNLSTSYDSMIDLGKSIWPSTAGLSSRNSIQQLRGSGFKRLAFTWLFNHGQVDELSLLCSMDLQILQ